MSYFSVVLRDWVVRNTVRVYKDGLGVVKTMPDDHIQLMLKRVLAG